MHVTCIQFQETDLTAFMGALEPPWVVAFVLRKREPFLEQLPVRFPGHHFTVIAFHDAKGEATSFLSLSIFRANVRCLASNHNVLYP